MSEDTRSDTGRRLHRRTLLQSTAVGGAIAAGLGLATAGSSSQRGDEHRGNGGHTDRGFPPSGTTEYGRSVELGNGEVRTFTSVDGSGDPKYHGVEFDRAALEGLPRGGELADADNRAETDKYRARGQAVTIHFKESLQFFLPFPDAAESPFTFLGLNWNPGGHHGGAGAWLKPHFDIHFHMLDPATVDDVTGPGLPPYDTGNGEFEPGGPAPDPDGAIVGTNFDHRQLPEGYERSPEVVADQRYIRDMGEHAAPGDAPELPDGPGEPGDPDAFGNTLIQGFIGDETGSQLAFVEPMITREFFADFSKTAQYDVPQPKVYPHDLRHPTQYTVRDVPARDAVTVVMQSFEDVS